MKLKHPVTTAVIAGIILGIISGIVCSGAIISFFELYTKGVEKMTIITLETLLEIVTVILLALDATLYIVTYTTKKKEKYALFGFIATLYSCFLLSFIISMW
jgi:hypothetical protein